MLRFIRTAIAWPLAIVGAVLLLASLWVELGDFAEANARLRHAGTVL